jgi:hypothetical protein
MRISSNQLRYDLDVLRHGGAEGVGHFREVGQECFYEGGQELLNDWIALAAPALPAADRHAGIGALMNSLFGDDDVTGMADDERHTLLIHH